MSSVTPWEFIDRVAEGFGVKEGARRKWRKRGVPHRWRLPLLQEARKERVKLKAEDFEATRPASNENAA